MDKIDRTKTADPLRPFKTFLGKTVLCGFLAVLPITISESMWSSGDWEGYARRFEGSTVMWVAFSLYLMSVILVWCHWITRCDSRGR